jgi:hypothetical protein
MRTVRLLGMIIILGMLFLPQTYADAPPIEEYKVKAGYLFNFTKFITWVDTNSETFNICILGNDPFGELIDPIEQRSAFNKPIKLFRLTAINKEQHCHIIYINSGINPKSLNTNNTLTVGENSNFVNQGGMIAFVTKDDKIKLQINLKLVQQSGLKISAKLLEVSEVIGGNND